jgi:hypothetical protein
MWTDIVKALAKFVMACLLFGWAFIAVWMLGVNSYGMMRKHSRK